MDELLLNTELFDALENKAKETIEKKARIHFLLDNVDDVILQKCINDLYVYRTDVSMMGYTTKRLLSTLTSNNHAMENVHDYMRFDSEVKQKTKKGGIL